jgi:hypothetical protein
VKETQGTGTSGSFQVKTWSCANKRRKEEIMMGIGTTLLIVAGILIVVLAPLFAFAGSCVADAKGRSKAVWLLLCGLFFPTLILLFLLPRSWQEEQWKGLGILSERYS